MMCITKIEMTSFFIKINMSWFNGIVKAKISILYLYPIEIVWISLKLIAL